MLETCRRLRLVLLATLLPLTIGAEPRSGPSAYLALDQDWMIQSSANVPQKGDEVSRVTFHPKDWHKASVPSTVLAALVKDGEFPDPYFGMNLQSIPGAGPKGKNFSNYPMPKGSPFAVPWWYRTEFRLPAGYEGKTIWLNFEGINYRADIWLNGQRIADAKTVAGAWRTYEFDVSEIAVPGAENVLAVEVSAPRKEDLAITFVDWNPLPPDKDMGIWRKVFVRSGGPVSVRYPMVATHLDLPSLQTAHFKVVAQLRNASRQPVTGTLKGNIGEIQFAQLVQLGAGESREVTFLPEKFSQLNVPNPRLWWPAQMGEQNLYSLALQFEVDGKVSDLAQTTFGIREITAELAEVTSILKPERYQLIRVNGRRILIRGAGWTPDMMLHESPQRLEQELRYVRDMNLNTLRLEGKIETDEFFDLADRYGILIMAGWVCCDAWENWSKWKDEQYAIASASLRDQLHRIRSHPSVAVWMNGSDIPPPRDVEGSYLQIEDELQWPDPVFSSSEHLRSKLSGFSGVKEGVYQYVPPSFWLESATPRIQRRVKFDNTRAAAFGFTSETGPGPAIPPVESLRRMLPPEHLWPIDDWWNFHANEESFSDIKVYTNALNTRYGASRTVEEFAGKSQVDAYDGMRAMFEAYTRNKYQATGLIEWMLNNAWPGLYWHLYDYYLRPGGGYFGAKKACEPLHPIYSYDDGSIWVASSQYHDAAGLKLTAKVFNLDMTEKYSQQATLDAKADSSNKVFTIPEIKGLSKTYFVWLGLDDAAGNRITSNLYWLSTQPDLMDWPKVAYDKTPALQYGDLTLLNTLPKVHLTYSSASERQGDEMLTHVSIENPGTNLAFAVHLRVNRGDGEEVLPVLWQDNYFWLLPGEKREITATYAAGGLDGASPKVAVEGWNVSP